MRKAEEAMSIAQGDELEVAMTRYTRAENEFSIAGGYGATAEAESIAMSLGIPERLFEQPLDSLSGGQRRRIELARILFSGADTLLLDEPTNHLDADSVVWLRDYLMKYSGGLVIISHDVNLIDTVVNKVFYLDANRNVIDVYNMGWKNICSNVNKMSTVVRLIAQLQRKRPPSWRNKRRKCAPKLRRRKPLKVCSAVPINCVPI